MNKFIISLKTHFFLNEHLKMARNQPDLLTCGNRPSPELAKLCDVCEGRCPICDSHSNLTTPLHICGDCSFGELKDRCIICSSPATHIAMCCRDCVLLGKDRDGCPRVINVGISRNDRTYERKRITVIPDTNS